MGRARFSIIRGAESLKKQLDALRDYEAKSPEEKATAFAATRTATGNKPTATSRGLIFILPFGNSKVAVRATAPKAATPTAGTEAGTDLITRIVTISEGYYSTTSLAADDKLGIVATLDLPLSKLAKLTFGKVDLTTAPKSITSRMTKKPYSYRKKNTVSTYFGQGVSAATKDDKNFETVSAAFLDAVKPSDGESVSIRAQQLLKISV